ncbi:MAG: hypothetical protein ACLTZH_02425 [Subdoligranulum sp.]
MCETKMKTAATSRAALSENGGILFYGIDSTAIVAPDGRFARSQRRYHRGLGHACYDRCCL